jgi:hypothetical protein
VNTIHIELSCEDETETPEHSEKVTGFEPGYAKAVRKVMKKAVGKWGWCSAVVQVTIKDEHKRVVAEATEYLGNCSYYSAADFAENSGYFNDMVQEAVEAALKKTKEVECHT